MLRLAAFLSSFQSPVPADFLVKIGLQCDERLAVEQLLGAWPAFEDGHQVEMQVRRCLIQVDDGGDDVLFAVALGEEVRTFKEEGVDVVAALIREERGTCADEEGCHEDGVVLHLALGRELFKPTVDECGVAAVRGDEVMVEARALAVDLRVGLGAISFVPLVLALDADDVAPLKFFHVTDDVCDRFSSCGFFICGDRGIVFCFDGDPLCLAERYSSLYQSHFAVWCRSPLQGAFPRKSGRAAFAEQLFACCLRSLLRRSDNVLLAHNVPPS